MTAVHLLQTVVKHTITLLTVEPDKHEDKRTQLVDVSKKTHFNRDNSGTVKHKDKCTYLQR